MRGFTFLLLAAVAGIGFTVTTPKAEAQVASKSEQPLNVPMATMTSLLITVLPLAITVRNGLTETCFIGAGPWFHGASEFQGNVNNRLTSGSRL